MGILNGNVITDRLTNGFYNRTAKRYAILVDGELLRYKGMVNFNLSRHDAELAIATTSFEYLCRLITHIHNLMGCKAEYVTVYMDGIRVRNKRQRAPFQFNGALVRDYFVTLCKDKDFNVNILQYGESELQMYLMRDQTMELNVFVTNDSDMISICYGHEAKIEPINGDLKKFEYYENTIDAPRYDPGAQIQDANGHYGPGFSVTDSCLWLKCGSSITAIGFDNSESTMGYSKAVFRIFLALCGTDFTPSLYTKSLIEGILSPRLSDSNYVNGMWIEDVNAIAAVLLVIGLRGGGSIKRYKQCLPRSNFCLDDISRCVKLYCEYIETGKMSEEIPQPDMGLATRHYLYALRNKSPVFTDHLSKWACNTPISTMMAYYTLHIKDFNPNQMPPVPKRTKISDDEPTTIVDNIGIPDTTAIKDDTTTLCI